MTVQPAARPTAADMDVLTSAQLDIVSALQVAPRTPHSALAEILDVPRSTIARQIQSLRDAGIVRLIGRFDWPLITSGMPSQLWIRCDPGRTRDVAEHLRQFTEVQFVMITTGSIDIYADIYPLLGSDMKTLITSTIPSIPGISSIRTHLVLKTTKVGQSWRLNRLEPAQTKALEGFMEPVVRAPFTSLGELSDLEYDALKELGRDVRVSSGDLARRWSVSSSTAYRTVQTLLQSGAVTPRVEVEPAALGYRLNVIIAMQVDASEILTVLAGLTMHDSARMVTMVAGSAPVIFGGVFRGEDELADFLTTDVAALRGVRSMDICVGSDVLRRYWMDRDGNRIDQQIPGLLKR